MVSEEVAIKAQLLPHEGGNKKVKLKLKDPPTL